MTRPPGPGEGGHPCSQRLTMAALAAALAAALLAATALAQEPTPSWRPNFTPLGLFCFKDAQNPNIDPEQQREYEHSGGCGCENTQFRWTDGQLYMMESHGHNCDPIFEGYNSSTEGDCTYFRIRHMLSGRIIANVSESLRHSFFSAVRFPSVLDSIGLPRGADLVVVCIITGR